MGIPPAIRGGLIYGVLCFAAGFVFGALRELVLVPAFGPEPGRLIEFPLVTLAVVAIAWQLVRRAAPSRASVRSWVAFGAIGLATLLIFESALALLVLGVPLEAYLAGFDIRRGALFPVGLLVMLAAPAVFAAEDRHATDK